MALEVLQLKDLSYERKGRTVFDHLNLTLYKGEIHAVMSGRAYDLSNFCDLIAGFLELDADTSVIFQGAPLKYQQLRKHSYVVTTENGMFPEFSIAQNLFINSMLLRRQELAQTKAVFDFLDIKIDPQTRVNDLSGSQRKLLEVVRGYTQKTSIMMLQDTLYHIDNTLQSNTISVIRKIAESGVGILYTTSKLEDALMVSDRISVIEKGKVLGCYATAQVRKSPKHMMQLMAGLEVDSFENQDMIEVINQIANTREILDSTSKLYGKLKQYVDNIIHILEADACCISGLDESGQEFFIESSGSSVIPQVLIKRLANGFQGVKVYSYENIPQDVESPYRAFLCAQIGGTDVTPSVGYVVVGYESSGPISQRNQLLLSTFAQDILMTLETSRLKTRSLLLQESNHRIKNNLQMIVSLLYMQKRNFAQAKTIHVETMNILIADIVSRIKSIALVHEILTGDGEQNGSIVLLRTIIDGIVAFYKNYNATITVDVEQIMLKYDKATFIALIINELLSNCFKHAFVGANIDENQIGINCCDLGAMIEIKTTDNGVGIDEQVMKEKSRTSCGLQIIKLAADSVGGEVTYHSRQRGMLTCVRIPKENLI